MKTSNLIGGLVPALLLVACGDPEPTTGRVTSAAAYANNGISWSGNGIAFMADTIAWPGNGIRWETKQPKWVNQGVVWSGNTVAWTGHQLEWQGTSASWSGGGLQLSGDHGATWVDTDPSTAVPAGPIHDGPALLAIVPVPSAVAGASACGALTPGIDTFQFRASALVANGVLEGSQLELVSGGLSSTLSLNASATVAAIAVSPAFDLAPLVLRFTRRATLRLAGDQLFEYPVHTVEYCDPIAAAGFELVGAVLPVPHIAIAPDGRLARIEGAAALITPPGAGLTAGLPAKIVVYGRVPVPAFAAATPTLQAKGGQLIDGDLFILHAAVALCNGSWVDDLTVVGTKVRRQVCFTVPGQPIALAGSAGEAAISYASPFDTITGTSVVPAFALTDIERSRPERLDNASYVPTGWLAPDDVVAAAPTHAASGPSNHRLKQFLERSPEPERDALAEQLLDRIGAVVLGGHTGTLSGHARAAALVTSRDPAQRRGRFALLVTSMEPDPASPGPPYPPGAGVGKQCFDDDPHLLCKGSRKAVFDRSFHGDCVCDLEEPCGGFDCDAACDGPSPICR